MDVANDPGGREQLAALGLRSVPIVARGDQWVDGQNLEVVAKFVGLDGTGHVPLAPEVLYARLHQILTVAQACVRQIPADKLTQDATHNRKRDLRLLSHHLFRIAEAWLEVAEDGVFFSRGLPQIELADGTFTTSDEIADYGAQVIARLERWWNQGQGHDFEREVDTYFGKLSMHRLFERSTWHPAQHTRQLISVLESFGIAPAMQLTPALLQGLPLPERLWE